MTQKVIDHMMNMIHENASHPIKNRSTKPLPSNDGMPLGAIKHHFYPHKSWYFKLWKRIQGLFIRPKFSKGALEPAEKIKSYGVLDDFGIPRYPIGKDPRPEWNKPLEELDGMTKNEYDLANEKAFNSYKKPE